MPAKRRSASGKKAAEPVKETAAAATRRSTRGVSASSESKSVTGAKRKASPSPSPAPKRAASAKKGRTSSPSPAPSVERPRRGRSTSKKEEPKPEEKPASASSQKGRVTRNVVQEVEEKKSTGAKSRSSSRGAKTPKKKVETPKKKTETPKQKAAPQPRKSTTPKHAKETPKKEPVTPKQKTATPKKGATPKQKTPQKKQEPVKKGKSPKSSPVQKKKPESPPKSSRSRRSRQSVEPVSEDAEEKVLSDMSGDTAEKDKEIEDKTPEQEETVDDTAAETVEDTSEDTTDKPEGIIAQTEDKEQEKEGKGAEEENEQKEVEEEKSDLKGEEPVDNVADEDESSKEDQGQKEEPVKTEDTENVEVKEVEEVEEDMETGDVTEAEKMAEEESEPEQSKTVEIKKAEQTEAVDEVSNGEDAEIAVETENAVEEGETAESIVEENMKDDTVNADSNEKGEDELSEQEVSDDNKDSVNAIITEAKQDIVNDLKSAEEIGNGSGDQEQSKKTGGVEEISDDDIEEIDTKQNNGEANEGNNEIEVIDFVEQKDKYVENLPTKRKIDDVETELDDSSPVKKARVSTDGIQENGSSSQEDIVKDYVVIEMGDVPQANSTEVQSSLPNPIFNRTFIPNPSFSGASDTSKQFSLVSYNMLADCHLFRNDYSFTEPKFLQPEYRLKKVIEELRYLDGDIVCMQEVDPQYFANQLLPSMRSLGYEGVHKQRADEYYNEGEATFFKTSRFDVIETEASTFSDLLKKELDGIEPAIQEAVKKYTNLPDVVIVAKLRCKNTGREVTVGNVHIQWGEMKLPDAQCVQIASAVKEIVSKANGDDFPHIICGDFNSPPMSPGYLVARDGYPSGDETINTLMKIENLELPDGKKASLVNSLWPAFQHTSSSLRSAYSEAQGYEPEISSFNRVMCDCVDYIFYSSKSLENVGVLQTASKEKVMETGGIPNCYFPSDHVSLKCVLSFQ